MMPGPLLLYIYMMWGFIPVAAVGQPAAAGNSFANPIREKKVYVLAEASRDGKISYDSSLASYASYDRNGNILENALYREGSLVTRLTCKYDKRGHKIDNTAYDAAGMVHDRTTYKYNDKDSLIEQGNYEIGNELDNKIIITYNNAGRKIKEVKIKEEDEERGNDENAEKKLYSYDDRGNRVEEKVMNREGKVSYIYQWKYDAANNKTEEVRKSGEREEWKFLYAYNGFNKLEKEEHIYPYPNSHSTVIMHYDKDHHLTEQTTFDYKNHPVQKNLYTYIARRLAATDENGAVTRYEYDSAGNKVKESTLANNELLSQKTFDVQGNLLTWAHYKSGDVLGFTEYFSYDSSSPRRLLKHTKIDKFNTLLEEESYIYDSKGNVVDETMRGQDAKLISKTVTVYSYYGDDKR